MSNIQKELSHNSLFTFVPGDRVKINPSDVNISGENSAISRALASNGLTGGIGVEIEFGVIASTSFNKKVASKITWTVYDSSGIEKNRVATLVASSGAYEWFPNTKDPRYFEDYVEICGKSTQDFIRLLSGSPTQYEEELSLFKEFKSGLGKNIFQ